MPKQYALSLQIPLKQDKVEEVRNILNRNGAGNPQLDKVFFDLSKISHVHFARWIITPATKDYPASLVYASNSDVQPDKQIADVSSILGEDLDKILANSPGYPGEGERNSTSRMAYLKAYQIKTPGFYVGAPNRTVEQIKNEAELQQELTQFVKDNGENWSSTREAYESIKSYLKSDARWDWARKKYSLPKINIPMMILLGLLLLIFLVPLLLFILAIHLFYESREKSFGITVNDLKPAFLKSLKEQEDIIYQNQLSQVFETKGGLRKIQLHVFLWVASYLAKYFAVHGQLLGTPTIHFARWVLIDGGKRFVFFSNFDGSFDEYLGDFVDNSGWGLNAIYSASVGYPTTYYVFGKGAYRILEFMGWGRKSQVRTPLWYSAYPWLGLQQVVNNSELRFELFNQGDLNDKQIAEMLRRI